ncbi:polysaccharide deacetylase family protein [Nonlabens marinus]|uniref:Polysaccharide deacetylase n=1 Tax=Nonlabens marinus S1-08 TaxID=1454201 RepID=W8VV44_9FLAO|nr:polysaccharide deacetylase family protein [Nonlabens marinus]BAO55118.1 polysaccharide deacetylase [Nonlabens marinus S1-08]
MAWYPDHIPGVVSRLFPNYIWHATRDFPCVHLTFDDGPTPLVTDFVLQQLDLYGFKATFFLIGDCVKREPLLKNRLLESGHQIGNHTYNHLDGWKTSSEEYVANVIKAAEIIDSELFRPPYGRITIKISKQIRDLGYKIVMWDVLSGDFDSSRSPEKCLKSLKKNTKNGSVIVFHDSVKAFPILKKVLPEYLEWLTCEGYRTQLF